MTDATAAGIGTKIVVFLFAIPILLFYRRLSLSRDICKIGFMRTAGLLLSGCTSESSGVPNLHLIELRGEAYFRIRIGYYGECTYVRSTSSVLIFLRNVCIGTQTD